MSWANKLLETYDICQSEIGKIDAQGMLLPIGHLTVKAQIEITLNEFGDFISANTVSDDDATTVIPVTEDSASRGSGITAHPLHDKLIYIAKDYPLYTNQDNNNQYSAHQTLLKKWVISDHTHDSIQSIYSYLEKGTIIQDLINYDVLKLEGSHLDKKYKLQKTIHQADSFVRFKLYAKDKAGDLITEPWYDKTLFNSFINFYKTLHDDDDLCYISGKRMYCTDKHPGKLRKGKDKAKLISSNDSSGFTFRGRFATKKDAISVGYETSQKIHNALRWLIQKQAYQRDGLTILTWNAHCDRILAPLENTLYDFLEDDYEIVSTNSDYASRINHAISGYESDIKNHDDKIVIMAMDAATTGRFSITYYHELNASTYYKNLKRWYIGCSWPQYANKNYMGNVGTPSPRDIISCAYGTLRNNFFQADENVMGMQMKLILPCIAEGRKIPFDIINRLNSQIKTMSTVNEYQWHRCMGILCAVYKKYYLDLKGKEWSVNIMENNNRELDNVAYRYGRLLAIYDAIERYALNIMDVKRPTNAMRLYSHFQDYPFKTLSILDKKLSPYIVRLNTKGDYLLEMKEAMSKELSEFDNIKSVRNLDASFVIGYDCQRIKIKNENEERKKKNKIKKENS